MCLRRSAGSAERSSCRLCWCRCSSANRSRHRGVALSDHRPAVPRGGLGRDRRPLVHRPSVTTSAGDSDREPIGMANGPGGQAGARDDPSSLDPDPRSHPRASCREGPTTSHGERTRFDHALVLWSSWVARFSLFLALVILFAAVLLVRT
jgi:hypothetical protein